jgi:RNA polymerase-binding transcription factor DksA
MDGRNRLSAGSQCPYNKGLQKRQNENESKIERKTFGVCCVSDDEGLGKILRAISSSMTV